MTDNIINFKRAKKHRKYAEKDAKAVENRVKFGRRKTDKKSAKFAAEKLKKFVEVHKLDDD